jgi:ADP-ribose pyrophosphatase YjhB (NUDIX family)
VGVGAVVCVSRAEAARVGVDDAPERGVVLIKRRYEPLAGQWSLPGGVLEVGETLDAAIAREVLEETGLRVAVGPVIEVFDRIMLDASRRVQYHFVLIDYLCRLSGGRLEPGTDAAAAVIADPAQLDAFELTEKTRDVIARGVALAA